MKKKRRAKQVKAIVWAGRRVHVLGQSHKLLHMLLQQPTERGIRHPSVTEMEKYQK